MDKFTDGLRKGIHAAILRKDIWPTNIDQWEEAARIEVRRNGITKAALGERGNYHLSTRQSRWQTRAQQVLKPSKKRDPDAMDIDATSVEKPNQSKDFKDKQAERLRIRSEGLCFKCLKKGHIKKECPDWKKLSENPPPYKPKARMATVKEEKDDESGSPDDLKDLARRMAVLDVQKKEDLFDIIMDEPGF